MDPVPRPPAAGAMPPYPRNSHLTLWISGCAAAYNNMYRKDWLKIEACFGKVDKSHFAVSSKSRLKFYIFIWPCGQARHIELFITENCLKIKTIFFSEKLVLVNKLKSIKNSFFENCCLSTFATTCFNYS